MPESYLTTFFLKLWSNWVPFGSQTSWGVWITPVKDPCFKHCFTVIPETGFMDMTDLTWAVAAGSLIYMEQHIILFCFPLWLRMTDTPKFLFFFPLYPRTDTCLLRIYLHASDKSGLSSMKAFATVHFLMAQDSWLFLLLPSITLEMAEMFVWIGLRVVFA